MATKKAPSNGIYTTNRGRFLIRAGDEFPEGEYKFEPDEQATEEVESAAAENGTSGEVPEKETAAQKKAREKAEKEAAERADNQPILTPEGGGAPLLTPESAGSGPAENR